MPAVALAAIRDRVDAKVIDQDREPADVVAVRVRVDEERDLADRFPAQVRKDDTRRQRFGR